MLRLRIWEHFRELQTQGTTLFVTTQYVAEAAYCDLVAVMAEGRVRVVDTPDRLRALAFGGDEVSFRVVGSLLPGQVAELADLAFVKQLRRVGQGEVRLIVDQARTAMPGLVDWAGSRQLRVEAIEEYQAPFDEVFVELVRQVEDGPDEPADEEALAGPGEG